MLFDGKNSGVIALRKRNCNGLISSCPACSDETLFVLFFVLFVIDSGRRMMVLLTGWGGGWGQEMENGMAVLFVIWCVFECVCKWMEWFAK